MTAQKNDLSFGVLSLLSKERGVYGIRNGDHERYQRHCSNKIHRLRQVSGLTCGKGKVYKKPVAITKDTVKDVRQLQLLLFSSERSLAHSHRLKSLSSKPNVEIPKRTLRKEQISWLRAALKSSTSLYTIATSLSSSSQLDTRTLAEITIYHLSIRSELSFERSNWAESLTDLCARRRLLMTMGDAAKNSYDHALANEFIDSYDPLIRFCAYKLGRKDSHDIEGVVSDIDDEMMGEAVPEFLNLVSSLREAVGAADLEKGRKELQDVSFAGDKIDLRNAEFVQVMLKVQETLGRLQHKAEGGKGRAMKGWDSVLSVLGDAEGVAKRLLDDHEASGSSTSLKSTRTAETLSLAHQYIVFLLLSYRVKRDLVLVETLQNASVVPSEPKIFKIPGGRVKVEEAVKSLAAIIKLYDTILQSLSQVRSLAIVEEKDGVRIMAEGLEAFFHSKRCYQLARLHCIHPAPSYASAVQLVSRADTLAQKAKRALTKPDVPLQEEILTIKSEEIDKLAANIQALESAAKEALFAERIPKPVFFDTAFNYIDLPMDDLEVLAGIKKKSEPPTPSKASSQPAAHSVHPSAPAAKPNAPVEKVKAASNRTTRETTPALEEDGPKAGEKPKGWLGGWFGRS
ncbi:hypothetical protein BD324DRAFT_633498 [Kockovaella imperatae]|uniref:Signal recognition particle subunit SRP68 n=1 Tax=Kockovaella imperatae TaxID=4999 RepID=A0A1Y1UBX9_9TREE|nr:hypothetical protein BD324DRAFT_633498 [Kockovaella imperatae]ORX34986.1 hypothetical protein BD324DRAFT_633498 [Kockovaella imperatae]